MNWYKNLYVGEEAGKEKNKILRKLEKHKPVFGVYVITLAANEKDLLDMIPAYMLYREDIRQREILGLAISKEEAMEVCKRIIDEVFRETGGYDVRSYFT